MVGIGILVSFWDGLSSGAMLVSRSVPILQLYERYLNEAPENTVLCQSSEMLKTRMDKTTCQHFRARASSETGSKSFFDTIPPEN